MTDVVFFVKLLPTGRDLDWTRDTRLMDIDLPAEFWCSGDPLCSSGYRRYVDSLRDSAGRALPALLAQAVPGVEVDRIAFVGYSAAHGLLDALAEHAEDRRRISAFLLLDATFAKTGATSTKPGYVAFGIEAARGEALLVSATADVDGPGYMAGNESFGLVWRDIQEGARMREVTTPVREPLPRPARGPFRIGLDAFWYDYSGQLGHGGVGQLAEEMMAAYLVLYWSGTLGAPKQRKRGIFTTILGAVGAVLSGLAIGKYVKDRKEEE